MNHFYNQIFSKKESVIKVFKEKISERLHQFLMVKNDFENQNCAIFEEVVDNFSDNDLIRTYSADRQ